MRTLLASPLILSLAFSSACASKPVVPISARRDPAGTVDSATRQRADALAMTLLQELRTALESELTKGRPADAIRVCSEIAPAAAGRLSRESGWQVRRVGTRVRNPLLGMPDAWEQRALAEMARRAAEGERLEGMSVAEIVDEPGGRYARYARAIPVGAPCIACHGPRATMSPALARALSESYPHDEAVDYAPGELRGAVTVKVPLSDR